MNKWALLLGVAAALGVAVVVTNLVSDRDGHGTLSEEVPDAIADCLERIQRIETALNRLDPAPDAA